VEGWNNGTMGKTKGIKEKTGIMEQWNSGRMGAVLNVGETILK